MILISWFWCGRNIYVAEMEKSSGDHDGMFQNAEAAIARETGNEFTCLEMIISMVWRFKTSQYVTTP